MFVIICTERETPMYKYVIKRVLLALMTAFIIISLTFILFKLAPAVTPGGIDSEKLAYYENQVALGYLIKSPVELPQYGEDLWRYLDNSSAITYYYYNRPALEQYGLWLKNIVTQWNWGVSSNIAPGASAIDIIASRLPVTVKINVVAAVLSVPLGIALGIWAALKKGKLTDRVISVGIIAIVSLPSFVLISLLLLSFNGILPDRWPIAGSDLWTTARGYVIPVLAMSLGAIAGYGRFVRGELAEVISSDYLLLARTKGLTKTQSITRHALRNAMVPVLPSILAEVISVLGGSPILEGMYNIPGIGGLFIDAIRERDYNVLMVDMAIFTTIGLLASVILDISYGFLDPRIRMGEKK